MKITSGIVKGRKITFSKTKIGNPLRPTSEKVRQAIFNILGNKIVDSVFLDLYSGTGAVGIEAISRGAKSVIMIDSDPSRIMSILETVEKFNLKNNVMAFKDKAYNFVKNTNIIFDIIFIDPPYQSREQGLILPLIKNKSILADDGKIIIEHSSKNILPENIDNLILRKNYRYGDTILSVYKNIDI